MAEPVPAGSDVSSGTYSCTQCGYELDVSSTKHLPPCPSCGNAVRPGATFCPACGAKLK